MPARPASEATEQDGMAYPRSRLALSLAFATLLWSAAALAQLLPGQPAAPAATEAPEEQGATGQEHARVLAEILQDEQARQALIDQLLQIAAGGGDTAAGAAAEDAAGTDEDLTIAREVARYTREAAESLGEATEQATAWTARLWESLTASGGRLEGLGEATLSLLVIVAATIVIFHALGFLTSRLFDWLAQRARDARWLKIAVLLVAASLIDALVILIAWAGGYALALWGVGTYGRMDVNQSLYLNAFLLIESTKVVLRFFLAPRYADLRLVPLPDLLANYWYFWLSRIIGLLGYGMLLVVPIISFNLSHEIGLATEYLIGAAALAIAIVVVLQNRQGLRQVLVARGEARESDFIGRGLMVLARIWHLLAIAYCIGLFVTWVVHPYRALPFMLSATGESILAIVLGILVASVISRAITAGLRLPDEVKQRLPLLEARLNAFVPGVLHVMRTLVLAGVVLMIARAWGLFDVLSWAASTAGQEVVARIVSAGLILLAAGLLWIALSSWIEYRLNPNRAYQPSARARTLLALLRNAVTVVIATVTLMLVLSEVGVNIAPLLAGAGVLGLAVGFGAQKLVQDIITGAFIQFENAINEGDVVTAAGITGTVERLTIRSVGLRDLYGVYHIIPFSSVDAVSNCMRGFGYHVAEIGIAYRENIDEARALMHEAFDELRRDPELGPTIIEPLDWHGLTAFGDSAVVLRARIKTRPGKQWAVGRAYNAIMKRLFDEHGIEIPFPHMTLYFGQDKEGMAPPLHTVVDRRQGISEQRGTALAKA
jgi:moderate conductance mechanosensitive channel